MSDEKIRRQYFNGPIYLLSTVLIFLYFFVLITDLATGRGILEAVRELIMSLWIPLVWIGPLIILSFLNRSYLGKTIYMLTPKGLQHDTGFVPWEQITMIEYEIVLPHLSYSFSNRIASCFAHIHIKDEKDLLLVQAPYMLLGSTQKYNSNIKAGFTQQSMRTIRFLVIAFIIFVGASLL